MTKRGFLLLLILLACCMLACCSGAEVGEASERTTVYRPTKIEWPEHFGADLSGISVSGGRVFVKGWDTEHVIKTETGYLQDQKLFSLDADGTSPRVDVLEADGEFDKIASIVYTDDGERFETLTKLGDNNSFERVTVRRYGADDTQLAQYECGDLFGLDITKLRMNIAGEGGFFVRRVFSSDGETIIVSNTGVAVLDKKGERRLLIESRDEIADAALQDGMLLLIYTKNGSCYAKAADLTTGEIGDKLKLPERFDTSRRLQLFGLDGCDLAVRDDKGVWELTRQEDGSFTETLLCSFTDSDFVGTSIQGFAAVNRNVFFATVSNQITNGRELYRLEMVKPEELVEKTTLVVGSLCDMAYYAQYAAAELNLMSETHRFSLKTWDYAKKEDGSWDTDSAVKSFDLDIAAGDIPDILIIPNSSNINIEKYIDVGLFCDLYSLMDASERGNFLKPVLAAGERDEKLYLLPLHCNVETIFTTKDVSEWTLDGVMDLLESLGEDEELIQFFSCFRFADLMLTSGIDDFVDYEAGTVDFDNPTFRRFAELYKSIDGVQPYDKERSIALSASIGMTQPSKMARQIAEHGDALKFVGYPDADGGGTLLSPNSYIAVSSKCEHKEAAWDFIKLRLSDEYLAVSSGINAPVVTHSAFENWCAENEGNYYFVTDQAIRIFRDRASFEAAEDLGAGKVVSEAEHGIIDTIRKLVMNAKPQGKKHRAVMNIVTEELSDYVGKNYTTDELVKRIEGRVGIYVSEQS